MELQQTYPYSLTNLQAVTITDRESVTISDASDAEFNNEVIKITERDLRDWRRDREDD